MKNKMRVVIVDDLSEALEELKISLSKHSDIELVAEAQTPNAVWDTIKNGGIDVVFLDIRFDNIPQGNQAGFSLAWHINQMTAPPLIVFVSSYHHYALEAFNYYPFYCLPTPFNDQMFDEVLERLRKKLPTLQSLPSPKNAILEIHYKVPDRNESREKMYPDDPIEFTNIVEYMPAHEIVFIRTHKIDRPVTANEIKRIETIQVRLVTGRTLDYVKKATLTEFYDELKPYGLHLRVNSGCLVAIEYFHTLQHIPADDAYKLILKRNPEEFSVGERYREAVKLALNNWGQSKINPIISGKG